MRKTVLMLYVILVSSLLFTGCSPVSVQTKESSQLIWLKTSAVQTTSQADQAVAKDISATGDVTLGKMESDGFSLVLPADAYAGVDNISLAVETVDNSPEMPNAETMGEAYAVDTGGVGRLDNAATLIYQYDAQRTPDPFILCLGYYDGTKWSYIQADSKDEASHTVTFHIYHFSAYYPAKFKSELEAAKHYSGEMAARKVLGEGGGDAKAASRAISDLMASKLGLGENEFAKRMLADIIADQDVMKVMDECQQDGWSNTGYEKVMSEICDKLADHLIENRSGLTAEDGVVLTAGEKGFKEIGNLIKLTDSGSKLLGAVVSGDSTAAGKELFNFATDNTGALGKALKYTLQGMQNALDVWRDGEVEKAFQVYKEGSSGSLFGYGAIDALDFDSVWESMKGASRQLCIERIAVENDARGIAGMPSLSTREEDFYRAKVKEELKSEFERRKTLQNAIDLEKNNLDLIFTELDNGDMLDSSKVWYRGFGGKDETLDSRMGRMEHLIQRIYGDLKINKVYSGPQMTNELKGRISAASMAEMVRGYFAADTQAEAEEFLQDYYKKFNLALTNADLAGAYTITVTGFNPSSLSEIGMKTGFTYTFSITPSGGSGGTITIDGAWAYNFADDTLTWHFEAEGGRGNYSFKFTKTNGIITGTAVYIGVLISPDGSVSDEFSIEYAFTKTG